MTITDETLVADVAAEHPATTRVFARHGMDYCCRGKRSLRQAGEAAGLDVDALLTELVDEIESGDDAPENWTGAASEDLIAHIVQAYHAPLREELPRLEHMALKVARVHGKQRPVTLPALAIAVTDLRAEMVRHMDEEERAVFPLILNGAPEDGAREPIAALEHEHAEAGTALEEIRRLTSDFRVPEGACNTWRALWHGLEDLERTMHEHVHLENNILFPRALAS